MLLSPGVQQVGAQYAHSFSPGPDSLQPKSRLQMMMMMSNGKPKDESRFLAQRLDRSSTQYVVYLPGGEQSNQELALSTRLTVETNSRRRLGRAMGVTVDLVAKEGDDSRGGDFQAFGAERRKKEAPPFGCPQPSTE